jgi:hypothetical protein
MMTLTMSGVAAPYTKHAAQSPPAAMHASATAAAATARLVLPCQILPLPISRYRFKFQSDLVWDLIQPISNFCFLILAKIKS